jgi:Transposase and inactivated derivatives
MNEQENPDRLELQNSIPELKEKYPELKGVYSKVLQYEVYRLFSNLGSLSELKKKGRKVGRLRFKSKGWFKTFTYNQSGFKIIKTDNRLDKLHLSKIGDISIRMHREIEGEIKQITIKHKQTGEWFAFITTSIEIEAETEIETENEEIEKENKLIQNPVGIDVGIESFSTDSEGRKIENPRYYKKGLKKLEKAQKKLSKKQKKSKNRNKQKRK